jgi:hypothetical protein
MLKRMLTVALALVAAGVAAPAEAAEKIKVLIIDGENNHNWRKMTPAMKAILVATGRFDVTVSTLPDNKQPAEAWTKWKPEFAKYAAVVSNYNDKGKCRWPQERRAEFETYMKEGGGFVPVHAADNSSTDWPAYNEIIAVGGWGGRKPKDGCLLRKRDGKWTADPAPKGKSGSHAAQWSFPVITEAPDHPIMKGLPEKWMHAKEELYNSMRGPCKNVTVLASALSKATKELEPQAILVEYGKGKTCHIMLGHVGGVEPLNCVGFQTIFVRGTEFVATGKVTLPVPKNFPTADKTSIVPPEQMDWSGK